MNGRTPSLRAALAALALTASASACRSYFLTDELAGQGGAGSDAGDTDGAAPARHRIYVYGGTPDGVNLPEVPLAFYAEILPDGALGPWLTAPEPPRSMIWHTSVRGPDFVALVTGIARPLGGNRRLIVGSVVDGAVQSFSESPDLFPSPIHHGGAVLRGGTLYVVGGEDDTTPPTTDVWRSSITATTFTAPTRIAPLPTPLSRMAVAESAGGVFLVGGAGGDGASVATIVSARFGEDGELSAFEVQATSLPSARRHAAAVVHRDHLLVVGGQATTDVANVLSCPVGATGAVGSCRETTPLPVPRSRHRAVLHEGRLYVVGGRSKDGRTVYVGDVSEDGGVGAWRATSELPAEAIFTSVTLL